MVIDFPLKTVPQNKNCVMHESLGKFLQPILSVNYHVVLYVDVVLSCLNIKFRMKSDVLCKSGTL